MPIDFEALGAMSDAERSAASQAADQRRLDAAAAERAKVCKKAVVVTLSEEPSFRTLPSGDRLMILTGMEKGATKPLRAVYSLPSEISNNDARCDRFDGMARDLGGGDQMTLAGQWAKRGWNNAAGERQETWEFKTQHLARGEMTMERAIEVSSKEPGGEFRPGNDNGVARAASMAARAGREV